MTRTQRASAAHAIPPGSDEGPTVAAVASHESKRNGNPNSQAPPFARQALRVIEGESKAAQYLARLQTRQADPDELALIVAMLYGATLRCSCRVIEKLLGVCHA